MRHYTQEQTSFLKEHVANNTWVSLAEAFNKQFNTEIPWPSIRYYCCGLGLSTNDPRGYTEEEQLWLQKNANRYQRDELRKQFNTTFNKNKTVDAITNYCIHRGWFWRKPDNYKLSRMGLSHYTEEQTEWLRTECNKNTWDSLAEAFNKEFDDNKTRTAIRHYCQANGIQANKIQRDYPDISRPDALVYRDIEHYGQRYNRYVYEQSTGEILLSSDRIIPFDGDKFNLNPDNLVKLSKEEYGWFQWLRLSGEARKDPDIMGAAINYAKLRGAVSLINKQRFMKEQNDHQDWR